MPAMTRDGVPPPPPAAGDGSRRCSQCGIHGHNARTCTARHSVKLFGVRIGDKPPIRNCVSMVNLAQLAEGSGSGGSRAEGYGSEGDDDKPHRKRGESWSEEEHKNFLLGLQILGKGDWRGISRNYVGSRTPTQVASHAQKYFIRQTNNNRRKRRSSLFDMVIPDSGDLPLSRSSSQEIALSRSSSQEVEEYADDLRAVAAPVTPPAPVAALTSVSVPPPVPLQVMAPPAPVPVPVPVPTYASAPAPVPAMAPPVPVPTYASAPAPVPAMAPPVPVPTYASAPAPVPAMAPPVPVPTYASAPAPVPAMAPPVPVPTYASAPAPVPAMALQPDGSQWVCSSSNTGEAGMVVPQVIPPYGYPMMFPPPQYAQAYYPVPYYGYAPMFYRPPGMMQAWSSPRTVQASHEPVRPVAVHSSPPINVEDLYNMSELNLKGDSSTNGLVLPLPPKPTGRPERQSAFHGIGPANGSSNGLIQAK